MTTQYDDLFVSMTDIDRRKCSRTVPMKVLSMGLGRTGTESLASALKILGYNDVYHGFDAFIKNSRDCEMWWAALRAKYDGVGEPFGRKEFDQVMGHCQAAIDIPAICFAPELIKAYPEAKVILTVRDVDEWYNSVKNTLDPYISPSSSLYNTFIRPLLQTLDDLLLMPWRWNNPVLIKTWTSLFKGDFKSHGKEVYKEHYAMVKSLVPPENLLLYNIKEGWEPLCEFLGTPVPSVPVPCGNSTGQITRRMRRFLAFKARGRVARIVSLAGYVSLAFTVGKVLRSSGVFSYMSKIDVFFR